MNDELNNKEKAIKSILQQANWGPNTDDVWAQLEGKLPTERIRRRVVPFWWTSGTMVFVVLSLIVGYNLAKLESNQIQKAKSVLEDRDQNETLTIDSEIKTTPVEKTVDKTNVSNESISNTAHHKTENLSLHQSKSKVIEPKLESITKHEDQFIIKINKTKNQIKLTLHPNEYSDKPNNPSSQSSGLISRKIDNLNLLSISNLKNLDSKSNITKLDIGYAQAPLIQPISKRGIPLFFRLRIGGGKTLVDAYDIKSTSEFDQRVFGYEDGKISFDSALEIGTWWKNTKIYGGITYGQSLIKYGRNDTSLSFNSTNGTETIIIDENGNSQNFIGTVIIPTETKHDLQWHRRHTHIDLHLDLGKTLLTIGNFSFGLETLVGYNINTTHSGYYFSDSREYFQKFDRDEQHIYKNNTGFHAAIMGQLSFQLGSVDLSLIPVWRKDLSTITKFENFYQIKNSQLGLQLGISYTPLWK